MDIEELIKLTKERNASDLILTAGSPAVLRIDKKLVPTKLPILSYVDVDDLIKPLLDDDKKEKFIKNSSIDFIHSISGWGRFRVTIFKQRGSTAVAIRRFSFEIPSLEELHLPEASLKYFTSLRDGLVLVTGPAGSGKSTTLACMIRMINENDSLHIVTMEEPIEYLFKHKMSIIEQRAIPDDSPSFSCALKEALRQSPDVVVVGEVRDTETLRETLRVAESGVLVLATFHTATASDTLIRLINFFPGEEQQTRLQLSLILRGVLSQQLIPLNQKQGVVPALEVLVVNERVSPIIREGNVQQIDNVIETSSKFGMQSLDQSLISLYNRKLISKENLVARLRRRNSEELGEKEDVYSMGEQEDKQIDSDTIDPNF